MMYEYTDPICVMRIPRPRDCSTSRFLDRAISRCAGVCIYRPHLCDEDSSTSRSRDLLRDVYKAMEFAENAIHRERGICQVGRCDFVRHCFKVLIYRLKRAYPPGRAEYTSFTHTYAHTNSSRGGLSRVSLTLLIRTHTFLEAYL